MANSIFARIGTIKGESPRCQAQGRDRGPVVVVGLVPVRHTGQGGGGGAGKASFHDFTFTHHVDKASPVLMKACATGSTSRMRRSRVRKAGKGQQEYLVITMSDLLVTGVSTSVSVEGDATMESVGLAFAKVDLEYKPQKPDGSLEAGVHFKYDLKAHKEG